MARKILVTVGRTDDTDKKYHMKHDPATADRLVAKSKLWEIIDDPREEKPKKDSEKSN